jgi:hypothetical protein
LSSRESNDNYLESIMAGEVKDLAAWELRLLFPIIGLWIKSVDGSTKSSEGKDHLEVHHQFLIL